MILEEADARAADVPHGVPHAGRRKSTKKKNVSGHLQRRVPNAKLTF